MVPGPGRSLFPATNQRSYSLSVVSTATQYRTGTLMQFSELELENPLRTAVNRVLRGRKLVDWLGKESLGLR